MEASAEENLLACLAALVHEQWAGWMQYLLTKSTQHADGSVTIPPALVEQWRRQMATPYHVLPFEERASDRVAARHVLQRLEANGIIVY